MYNLEKHIPIVQYDFLFWLEALDVASLEVVEEVSVDESLALLISRQGHFTSSSWSSSGFFFINAAVKFRATMFFL